MDILIRFDENRLLDEIMNLVCRWTHEIDYEYQLFEKYYRDMIQQGLYNKIDFDDLMTIVDDNYVNNLICFVSIDEAKDNCCHFSENNIVAELDSGEILMWR